MSLEGPVALASTMAWHPAVRISMAATGLADRPFAHFHCFSVNPKVSRRQVRYDQGVRWIERLTLLFTRLCF